MVAVRVCELCGGEAVMYCGSDSAFLCCKCDARVHEVNFLVARHVRQPICGGCKEMTGEFVSGAGFDNGVWYSVCRACSPESCEDADSLSSSCISGTNCSREKPRRGRSKPVVTKRKKVGGGRVGGVLVSWCRKIGVLDVDVIVSLASQILSAAAAGRAGSWSARLLLAASLWLSLRLRRTTSLEKLRKLVELSGVPEKLILAGQVRIAGMLKDRNVARGGEDVAEEGWGESC